MSVYYSDGVEIFSNLSSRSTCQLTPAASAFSSMISALVSSVVNGLTSGWLVAFATGWIAWMAVFRVLTSAIYMLYRTVTNSWGPGSATTRGVHEPVPTEDDSADRLVQHHVALQTLWQNKQRPVQKVLSSQGKIMAFWPPAGIVRGVESFPEDQVVNQHPIVRTWSDLNQDVSFLGWFSWVWTAILAPITQIIWIAANMSHHEIGATKIVKGLTTAITALPLCIDCKTRYGDVLGWGRHIFRAITGVSCLLQGTLGAALLIQGVIDLKTTSSFPTFVIVIYPLLCVVWMYGSYMLVPMRDGGRRRAGQAHIMGYVLDVGVGVFAGLFLAAPAFALYLSSKRNGEHTGASDLVDYLSCEVDWWKRFAAVSP
jgi:hypothetical protein